MSPRLNLDLNTILDTAADMADSNGIDAVTLAELAKKLGIKTPSLYNHFNGMNGLRLHLAVYGIEKLYELLVKSTIGKSGDEAIHKLAEEYVSFVRKRPGLYDAIILVPDPRDSELQKSGDKIVDLVTRVLSAYNLEYENEIHLVRGLRSLLHGFASLEQKGGFGIPLSTDKSLSIMIDTFISGIHTFKSNPL